MIDPSALMQRVMAEIDAYEIPPHHPKLVGRPLSSEWYAQEVAKMRSYLVTPYAAEAYDPESTNDGASSRIVMIVAEDDRNKTLLAYDPHPDGAFVLAWKHPGIIAISHVRGDAVGCFLAR